MNDLVFHVGREFKSARKKMGYTTEETAKKLKISVGKVNSIENGRYDSFQVSLVSRISDVLELDIYSVCGNSFYNNKYSYKDYDKFFENILDFLKTNRTDINSIFIEKVEAEIKTINSVKKVISNNN